MLCENSSFSANEKRKMNNPFTGISTFLKAPYTDSLDEVDADIAIIGMPYDLGTAIRSGARFAPRAIREASTWNCYSYQGWYNPIDNKTYMDPDWKVVDCGDIDVLHTLYDQSFDNCEIAIRKLLAQNTIPFIIGGDHAITIPVLRAFDQYQNLCIIHIDAHLDFTKSPAGIMYGQGSPIRSASEMTHVGKIMQIGMRGIGSSQESDWLDARNRGNLLINMKQVREKGIDWVIDQIPDAEAYYVTFDIDSMDQSLVPGCGSPQPYGFYYEEVVQLFEGVAMTGNIVGFDLVEVCPPYDFNQTTSLYAASLMLDIMSYIWKYSKKRRSKNE